MASSPAPGGRWAIYYAPPRDHSLWRTGCRWLGRDPETDETFPAPAGIDPATWQAATATPRHYGFHATLKPPFRLREHADAATLKRRLGALTTALTPLRISLVVDRLGEFLALRPSENDVSMRAMAGDCVRLLDGLRAPASAEELSRGRGKGLSPRQESLLQRWGYPYVFEQFRFHLTLTGPLNAAERESLNPFLARFFRPALAAPVPIAEVALYHQDLTASPFRLVARFPLGGS